MKVKSIDDYEKLFFIVDDPVSSLSFDYIYSIAQCLKTLRIKEGAVELDGIQGDRVRLLILTHNDYFFNIVAFNNVVKDEGIFELRNGGSAHTLVKHSSGFVTPHKFHLGHVYSVGKGLSDVTPSTPNSIRSVVEGMWKFVRPECVNFAEFVERLRVEHHIHLRSVLINSFSHGALFEILTPHRITDIQLAASEALQVVEKLAPGQLVQIERGL